MEVIDFLQKIPFHLLLYYCSYYEKDTLIKSSTPNSLASMSPNATSTSNIRNTSNDDEVTMSINDFIQSNIPLETEEGTHLIANQTFEYDVSPVLLSNDYSCGCCCKLCFLFLISFIVTLVLCYVRQQPVWLIIPTIFVCLLCRECGRYGGPKYVNKEHEWTKKIRFRVVGGTITIEFFNEIGESLYREDLDLRKNYDSITLTKHEEDGRPVLILVRSSAYLQHRRKNNQSDEKTEEFYMKDRTQFRYDFRM